MAADDKDDPPKNPFVRWKQHVDAHIGMTLNGLLGIPAIMSKNLNLGRDEKDGKDEKDNTKEDPNEKDGKNNGGGSASSSNNGGAGGAPSAGTGNATSNSSPSTSNMTSSPSPNDDDNILAGVDSTQLLEWHKFIYYSPYSPLRLQQGDLPDPEQEFSTFETLHSRFHSHHSHSHPHHHHPPFGHRRFHATLPPGALPPPVPQDVPFGADRYAFTYADAFEDLLRASAGQPLLDLAARSYRNLRYQMRYGTALEPPSVLFQRLHNERLLDSYFRRGDVAAPAGTRQAVEAKTNDSVVDAVVALAERERAWEDEQKRQLQQQEDEGVDMGRMEDTDYDVFDWDPLDEEDDEEEENEKENKDNNSLWPRNFGTGFGGSGLFDELDRVFRILGRVMDEEAAERNKDKDQKDQKEKETKEDNKDPFPETEDELYQRYTALRNAVAEGEKSMTELIQTISSLQTAVSASATTSSPDTQVAKTQPLKTEEKTEEHVDLFGNRHVKTVVRRLDADGHEVSRETRYTVRSPTPEEKKADQKTEGAEKTDTAEKAEKTESADKKSTGWFWK